MHKYDVSVTEVREYQMTYGISAETPEEALELASSGEVDDEVEERLIGVTARHPDKTTLSQVD